MGSSVYLGACVDAEPAGQPTAAADGDDVSMSTQVFGTCTDDGDEDGVVFTSAITADSEAYVNVTANAACSLRAWFDFNGDGDWDDASEELYPSTMALNPGVNNLSFSVPAGAVTGSTVVRFRCATDDPVSYTGQSTDGEVEDYQVMVGPAADHGDAPAS